jgi:hypothetical protein
MVQELSVYVIVAFLTIGVMLVLCIDVIQKSRQVILPNKTETAAAVEESSVIYEENLAFPFYVDCSRSTDTNTSA